MITLSRRMFRISCLSVASCGVLHCAFPRLEIDETGGSGGDGDGLGGDDLGGSGSGDGDGDLNGTGSTGPTEECTPKQDFCLGNTVLTCADNGMSSAEKEICGEDQYCDVASAECKDGLCAPNLRTCDQNNVSYLCDAEGTALMPDSGIDCTDEGKTCVNGSCEGECAPGQTQCAENALQTCNLMGQYGTAEPCVDTICLGEPGSASCQGECAPGQVQCSGNGVQTCDEETGEYGSVTACPSTAPHCAGGTCGAPPSCVGLTTNCGPAANESCCMSPKVTGGEFDRINDDSYPATVSDFRLDKYEVTVGRWRKFVAAWDGGWRPMAAVGKHGHLNDGDGLKSSYVDGGYESGWDTLWESNVDTSDSARQLGGTYATWTASPTTNENRPINYVNWYESYAFCIWDGGFLPSEAEWNYAAAAGDSHYEYPWGNDTPTCALTNFLGGDAGSNVCYGTFTTNVGILDDGNGLYGQGDLAGNLWEWNLDWHAADATAFLANCEDCAYLPTSSTSRVNRGGAFNSADTFLPNSFRNSGSPTSRTNNVGLRCARAP